MGNLQLTRGKFRYLPVKNRQAFYPGVLLAAFEEQLVTNADAKKGPVIANPLGETVDEVKALQLCHAVSKGSLSGEENKREVFKLLW